MSNITVYTTPTCGFCHMVKQYLDGKSIKYDVVDVSKDPAKAQEMVQKSGQMGVPVTDFDGEIVVGFDRPTIDTIIKEKQLA